MKVLENSAFAYCENLTNLIIPSGVIEISNGLCYACTNLEKVLVCSEDIKRIGDRAFYDCKNLVEVIAYMDNLEYKGEDAFYGCNNLKTKVA